jgi:hypothetical protein
MASDLERYSDKTLFQIMKRIQDECNSENISLESAFSTRIVELIDRSLKIFGVIDNPKYIDDEFLWVLIKMNRDKLNDEKLSGSLDRPEAQEYEFDVNVSETVYQTTSWEHRVESYGSPYELVNAMDYNGDFDYWEGREGYRDIGDSETNEINIVKRSFKKI